MRGKKQLNRSPVRAAENRFPLPAGMQTARFVRAWGKEKKKSERGRKFGLSSFEPIRLTYERLRRLRMKEGES